MAFDCSLRCGLHVLMDQFIIEVVSSEGKPVRDGEVGEVLITDLQNLTMPILRYRIGDLAQLSSERCNCGRGTSRIQLEGRIEDAFLVDGRWLTTERVSNLLFDRFLIDQFELVETDEKRFQFRYVRPPSFVCDEQEIVTALKQQLGLTGEFKVRETTLIRPESSGKYRHCKGWARKSQAERSSCLL